MEELLQQVLPERLDGLAPLLSNAIFAAIFLILGFWFAGFVARTIRRRAFASERIDDTLGSFFASLARYGVLTVVVIAVLQRFGFEATSLVAVLGAATLAIGFALQGVLGNVAAGVMLVFFRPYRIGDLVEIGGHLGHVRDISLVATELATPQNVKVIVPNGEAWSSAIANYSGNDVRRIDITIGVSYDANIAEAAETIVNAARSVEGVLNEPAEPLARVVNLGDSSVDFELRAWAPTGDYWEMRCALTRAVKEALDRAGVEIPYPHRVVIGAPGAGQAAQ